MAQQKRMAFLLHKGQPGAVVAADDQKHTNHKKDGRHIALLFPKINENHVGQGGHYEPSGKGVNAHG